MATIKYLKETNFFEYHYLHTGFDLKTRKCFQATWFKLRRMRPSSIERVLWNAKIWLTPSQIKNEEKMNPKYAGENE